MIVTMKKECRCRSTASGPRVIIRDTEPRWATSDLREAVEVEAELVEFACDECDAPWTVLVKAEDQEEIKR